MNHKEVFYISISIFLCILAWLVTDVVHALTYTPVPQNVAVYEVKPLVEHNEIFQALEDKQP